MKKIGAEFTRVSPNKDGLIFVVPPGWFAISHRWIQSKGQRRMAHSKWFKITCGKVYIFRALRFSANLRGGPSYSQGDIVLEWSDWLRLSHFSDDVPLVLNLVIYPARWWHFPWIAVSHPDPGNRLAAKIAFVSLVLGVISLLVSFK